MFMIRTLRSVAPSRPKNMLPILAALQTLWCISHAARTGTSEKVLRKTFEEILDEPGNTPAPLKSGHRALGEVEAQTPSSATAATQESPTGTKTRRRLMFGGKIFKTLWRLVRPRKHYKPTKHLAHDDFIKSAAKWGRKSSRDRKSSASRWISTAAKPASVSRKDAKETGSHSRRSSTSGSKQTAKSIQPRKSPGKTMIRSSSVRGPRTSKTNRSAKRFGAPPRRSIPDCAKHFWTGSWVVFHGLDLEERVMNGMGGVLTVQELDGTDSGKWNVKIVGKGIDFLWKFKEENLRLSNPASIFQLSAEKTRMLVEIDKRKKEASKNQCKLTCEKLARRCGSFEKIRWPHNWCPTEMDPCACKLSDKLLQAAAICANRTNTAIADVCQKLERDMDKEFPGSFKLIAMFEHLNAFVAEWYGVYAAGSFS